MKTTAKNVIREESGKILILVLVLLVVGGLLLTPLLGLMSTGLVAGQVYEKKTDELYAADAGVEDALWQIKQPSQDAAKVPSAPGDTRTYSLLLPINQKDVEDITIEFIGGTLGNAIYSVTSRGSGRDGSATDIDAYVRTLPRFWTNAITSTGTVTLKPGSGVYGDIQGDVVGEKDNKGQGPTIDGTVRLPYPPEEWPTHQAFRDEYWSDDLEMLLCPSQSELTVENELPSGFHDGNLTIVRNKVDGVDVNEVKLLGTIYIKGSESTLDITKGNEKWVLDLNYNTIYVEGGENLGESGDWAIWIGGAKVDIKGPGAIIAEGSIYFEPNVQAGSGKDDFIFIMSIRGKVRMQPGGAFYGSVAGQEVELWSSDSSVQYTEPPYDPATGVTMLKFPFDAIEWAVRILSYRIS